MPFFEKQQFQVEISKKFSCVSCGLYKTCTSPKMKPFGNFKKKILVVGEYPDTSADQNNCPFAGRQERFLERTLNKYRIDLWEDCIVTTALRCKPKRKINKTNILACRRFLQQLIKVQKPKVIILMGDVAVESLIGSLWKKNLGKIEKWRGFTIPDQTYNAWICPIYTPNFVLNNEIEATTIWEQDLQRISQILHKKVPVYKEPKIDYITDLSILNEIKSGLIAFDYETTGIKPQAKGHRILCCSVADSENHVYVFEMPDKKSERKPFIDLLQNELIDKMAHNMKFEDNWTKVRLHVTINRWAFDTEIAAHIIDNRPGISSLKFQTYVRLGISDYDSELEPYIKSGSKSANAFNKFQEYMQNPDGKIKVLTYCAYDSINQYRIAIQMMKEMNYTIFPF